MIELIFIICTALFGALLIGIGSKMNWSSNDIINTISYGFFGIGVGVVFYALMWGIRWLLLGGLFA